MIIHKFGNEKTVIDITSYIIKPYEPFYNAMLEFCDIIMQKYGVKIEKVKYNYVCTNNVLMDFWILTTKQYFYFIKNIPKNLIHYMELDSKDPVYTYINQTLRECLRKNMIEDLFFQNTRFSFYNFESFKKTEIINNTLRNTNILLHKGLSITKVAKLKYNTVISCIKINEEQNFFVFGIMYDDRKELEKALASGILPNIKELILKNLTELDTEYHYFTPDNTRVAAFIRDQVSQYDYRDSTVEFKSLDDIIIL